MGQRNDERAPANVRRSLQRAYREIVRDAAGVAGAALVELLVTRAAEDDGPRWESVAFCAPAARRAEIARDLARSPATAELPEPRRRTGHRTAICEASIAHHLHGVRRAVQVFLPVGTARSGAGWLRIVRDGRPDRAALESYRALARQASGRLEAETLRRRLAARQRVAERDVTREKRALAELQQAKDTLAAL